MTDRARHVAILGSTGSIGRSTLDVIQASQGRLCAAALTAHSRLDRLCEQAWAVRPRWIVATDPAQVRSLDRFSLPPETELLVGSAGVEKVVRDRSVDIVVAAMVGSAGLAGAWGALEAGKLVALANKETLVMAGPLAMRLAAQRGAVIMPVDSEHSAVFQAMQAGRRADIQRVILTASGGPFRRHSRAQLAEVTVTEALAHPTWDMGPKITVDSATMMNKALEIIEARWLFDLDPELIDVVIHPQSIVHSMVEFRDGSVMAQLSPPDMRLPIQYALTYPERLASPAAKLDFTTAQRLDFEPPDPERFPALTLGHEVARAGGTAGAVLNAANEAAVASFLEGKLCFTQIVPACRTVLESHQFDPTPTLADLLRLDVWARKEITRWVST